MEKIRNILSAFGYTNIDVDERRQYLLCMNVLTVGILKRHLEKVQVECAEKLHDFSYRKLN
jgi:hypothetical protein